MTDMVERVARAIRTCRTGERAIGPTPFDFAMARAAIAAMPGWHDISTAPKDGTRFLGAMSDGDIETMFWTTSVWVRPGGAWVNEIFRSDTREHAPTHWMPLPEPPAALKPEVQP
jgi:hypothetical protein